jgi:ribosomal protein L30/L7E
MGIVVTLEWCVNRWGLDKVKSEVDINDNEALADYLMIVQDWVDSMGD